MCDDALCELKNTGKFNLALKYFKLDLDMAETLGDKPAEAIACDNLAEVFVRHQPEHQQFYHNVTPPTRSTSPSTQAAMPRPAS
jgi:hypothetical protein